MKTLILDSSTQILYVCLCIDHCKIYENYLLGQNDHAKFILAEIEKACHQADISLKELDQVVVGYGPGSYTGVRMSVTIGKMIATLEEKIQLRVISTLLLMASGSEGVVFSSIDARRGNCFGCVYDIDHEKYIKEEGLYPTSSFSRESYQTCVSEKEYVVDPFRVIRWSEKVENPQVLVPNYLRKTEAEVKRNDTKMS